MMGPIREAIKCSLLQQKTIRRTGTLRRKKKVVYGETCWVVLCVHDEKIPILEWYHSQDSIKSHQPFKVLDLLFANYVSSVVSDPRAFIIGFRNVEPIELAALQPEECTEWLNSTVEILRRLSILSGPSNIYESSYKIPAATTPLRPELPHGMTRQSEMSAESTPQHQENFPDLAYLNDASSLIKNSNDNLNSLLPLPPPLPPRSNRTFPERNPSSESQNGFNENTYDSLCGKTSRMTIFGNEVSSSVDNRTLRHNPLDAIYDSPRQSSVKTEPYSSPKPTVRHVTYDTLSPVASFSNISSSPLESTLSTNSLCDNQMSVEVGYFPDDAFLINASYSSTLSCEMRLSENIPVEESLSNCSNHTSVKGYDHPVRCVSLNLSVIVEHVLFVEVAGRIWVAGWSEAHDKQLSRLFSFGDELIEVENTPVQSMTDIPQLFYTLSTPGTPISLLLWPTPYGTTISLVKPISKNKQIGIVLHKRKNRIADVIADSSAARRGVPVKLSSPIKKDNFTAAVITEVAYRRLNPFAKSDQFFKRLDEIREGTEFVIVVQPHDFIKEMKQQIIATKHYSAYLCQA